LRCGRRASFASSESFAGGQPGSIDEMQLMLDFTARHGIKPIIETFPLNEADAALAHTRPHFGYCLV
jgi:D-arabinose 1-dehydrogenase-like Zn-dependent alcohol dehydrogenase